MRFILIFLLLTGGSTHVWSEFQPSTGLAQAKVLFEARNFTAARHLLIHFEKKSAEYPEAQYYLGRIAVMDKDYDASIQYFETAIEAKPDVAEYHNWLGVMYGVVAISANPFRKAYLAPKIKNEFEKAAKLEPDNLQTQWGLISYYTQAPGFLGGSWDKAFECAKVIARNNPSQGCRALGSIYAAQKKKDLAEKEFIKATKSDPDQPENGYALASFYEEEKLYDKAFAIYDGLMTHNPNNKVAGLHLGMMSARSGQQLDKGINCLNQYLNYHPGPDEPSLSGANLSLAMIYEKKGDIPRAKSYYETTLKLEPGMEEAKEGLARLR